MKKILILMFLLAFSLTACGNRDDVVAAPDVGEDSPLVVIATIFPQFDFVRQIAGDRVELSMLLSPGAESHGFEPTPRDIIALNGADLLIYVGGHGDTWVPHILASLEREDMRTVALVDLVDAVELDSVHHHHHDHDDHDHDHEHHDHNHHDHDHHDHDHHDHDHHDHDHDHHDHDHDHHDHDHDHHDHDHDHHDHDHDHHGHGHDHHDHDHDHHGHGHDHHDHDHHDHDHDHHYDEHVWTSPRNAIQIVTYLTNVLSELDPANAYFYHQNAEAFIAELHALDHAFAEVVSNGVRDTLVFGDRFPFRYLVDAYGLTAYAAFDGCSAETQASPATIAYLINKVDDEALPFIFHIEFSNRLIANVITEATGAQQLELHSAHNVSHADFNAGITYLDIMWRNVETLREALS